MQQQPGTSAFSGATSQPARPLSFVTSYPIPRVDPSPIPTNHFVTTPSGSPSREGEGFWESELFLKNFLAVKIPSCGLECVGREMGAPLGTAALIVKPSFFPHYLVGQFQESHSLKVCGRILVFLFFISCPLPGIGGGTVIFCCLSLAVPLWACFPRHKWSTLEILLCLCWVPGHC